MPRRSKKRQDFCFFRSQVAGHNSIFSDDITLGGAYEEGGTSSVGLQGHAVLQWVVGLQQYGVGYLC